MHNHTLDASSVKVCTHCGETKPLSEYHKFGNGLRPTCKPCTNAQNRGIYQKNKPAHLESKRRYRAQNPEARYETLRAYDLRNVDNRRAHVAVKLAIQSGQLPSIHAATCVRCGKPAEVYHHHSYEQAFWLDVEPLCRCCHGLEHRNG